MLAMQPLLELLHLLSEWRAKGARQAPPALRCQAGVGGRLSEAGAMCAMQQQKQLLLLPEDTAVCAILPTNGATGLLLQMDWNGVQLPANAVDARQEQSEESESDCGSFRRPSPRSDADDESDGDANKADDEFNADTKKGYACPVCIDSDLGVDASSNGFFAMECGHTFHL
eukprot:1228721-Rhodomonas_salina.1